VTIPVIDQSGLDAVVEAYAKGSMVRVPTLAWLDFKTTPVAVWPGEYQLSSGGVDWQGMGNAGFLIGIDNMEAAATLEASQFNVTLSGVDSGMLAAAANSDRSEYINRLLIVYALFCDEDWQPLANPMAIGGGFMGTMTTTRNFSDGVFTRQIQLPVNNLFYGRGVAPLAFWTDADQQQRFPGEGDTGLTFIQSLQDFNVKLPWRS
jgi:hypothetical protein